MRQLLSKFNSILRGRYRFLVILSIVVLGFLAIAISASVTSVRTLFVLDAQTEVLAATFDPDAKLSWWLEDVNLCSGKTQQFRNPRRQDLQQQEAEEKPCAGREISLPGFSGHVEINGEADLRIERLAHGPLAIRLRRSTDEVPFDVRIHDNTSGVEMAAASPLILTIKDPSIPAANGIPISLPILARRLEIGQTIDLRPVAQSPLLISGSVTVLGEVIMGSRIYQARHSNLFPGDQVSVPDQGTSIPGFVRIDDRRGLQTVFRVEADKLTTTSFFGQPDIHSLSFLDEYRNDPFFAGLWSAIAILATVIAVFPVFQKRPSSRP